MPTSVNNRRVNTQITTPLSKARSWNDSALFLRIHVHNPKHNTLPSLRLERIWGITSGFSHKPLGEFEGCMLDGELTRQVGRNHKATVDLEER